MPTPPADSPDVPVFLAGFMGAGKTTVGQALAEAEGWKFADLDALIEQREGKTVREIFAVSGEPEFRRLEHLAIAACRDMRKIVIALGGGAYIAETNRALLREIGVTVWLDCPLEICLRRIGDDPARPLLRAYKDMKDLFDHRRPAYALADLIIETGDRQPEDLASEIRKVRGR